jgi:hypothetical protein
MKRYINVMGMIKAIKAGVVHEMRAKVAPDFTTLLKSMLKVRAMTSSTL